MIRERFMCNESTRVFSKRLIWIVPVVVSVLLGLGISTITQFHAVTAEAQNEGLAQLTEELNGLKAQHRTIQAKWQSELLAQVARTLANESNKVKLQFVDFLKEIRAPGTAALVEMLQASSERVREKAVDVLGQIGEQERKAGRSTDAVAIGLAKALSDSSEKVRREALEELDDIRPVSPEAATVVVPALIAVRTSGSSRVRSEVLDALGRIGETLAENGHATNEIRDALIAGLTDKSAKVRTNAVDELSDIQAASAETFAALIGAFSDESKAVRRSTEKTLIQLGKKADAIATPMLAYALESSNSAVARGHIVDVLGAIGEARAEAGQSIAMVVPPLLAALQDVSDDVRRNAADELGEMPANLPEVLTALTHALNDSAKVVRRAAQNAIRRIEKTKQRSE